MFETLRPKIVIRKIVDIQWREIQKKDFLKQISNRCYNKRSWITWEKLDLMQTLVARPDQLQANYAGDWFLE